MDSCRNPLPVRIFRPHLFIERRGGAVLLMVGDHLARFCRWNVSTAFGGWHVAFHLLQILDAAAREREMLSRGLHGRHEVVFASAYGIRLYGEGFVFSAKVAISDGYRFSGHIAA